MKFLWKMTATFFGAGFFPIAPGTLASALAVLLYKFGFHGLAWPVQVLLLVVLFFVGVSASTRYARALNQKDPGRIVIDEICGQFIALFLMAPDWKTVLWAFFLFRIFDIIKPYPVRKLERLPQGWGIMADDVAAGLFSNLALRLIFWIL